MKLISLIAEGSMSCADRLSAALRLAPRAGIGLLLMVGHLAASIGFPEIPLPAGKDPSEPFPCQSRACGCRSAEQCRKSCCCFNRAQKIAWAKQNGVSISRVVPQVSDACVLVENSATSTPQKSCCSPRSGSGHTSDTADVAKSLGWILGIAAMKCGGHSADWNQGGVFAMPPAIDCERPMPLIVAAVVIVNEFFPSPDLGRYERPG